MGNVPPQSGLAYILLMFFVISPILEILILFMLILTIKSLITSLITSLKEAV